AANAREERGARPRRSFRAAAFHPKPSSSPLATQRAALPIRAPRRPSPASTSAGSLRALGVVEPLAQAPARARQRSSIPLASEARRGAVVSRFRAPPSRSTYRPAPSLEGSRNGRRSSPPPPPIGAPSDRGSSCAAGGSSASRDPRERLDSVTRCETSGTSQILADDLDALDRDRGCRCVELRRDPGARPRVRQLPSADLLAAFVDEDDRRFARIGIEKPSPERRVVSEASLENDARGNAPTGKEPRHVAPAFLEDEDRAPRLETRARREASRIGAGDLDAEEIGAEGSRRRFDRVRTHRFLLARLLRLAVEPPAA